MKGYTFLQGECQQCGKKTVNDDGEVIDTIIALETLMGGYPTGEYLGEWCSEECFLKDFVPKNDGV